MKKFAIFGLVLALLLSLFLVGCEASGADKAQSKESKTVQTQDNIYLKGQPVPIFNWSLQRDLWIQFYKAQNDAAGTWSVVLSDYGNPLFITESIGYPIPMDTQLTNPWKTDKYEGNYNGGNVVLSQSEPNGLYTSPNTNATIIMTVDENGEVAPVYSEPKVLAFPFPVRWNADTKMFERIPGGKATISLKVNKK